MKRRFVKRGKLQYQGFGQSKPIRMPRLGQGELQEEIQAGFTGLGKTILTGSIIGFFAWKYLLK